MSSGARSSTSRPRTAIFQLAAHTETANALAEKMFEGKISQKDYDAQTYSTTILSNDRSLSVPIVLSSYDSLATLKVYAHRRFKVPLAEADTTKMYGLWSKKVFYACGVHTVPENLVLLDPDTFSMILQFMKASPQVEQLLVQFKEDDEEVAAKFESTTLSVNQAAGTPAPEEEVLEIPIATHRGSLEEAEQTPSRKGKGREISPSGLQPTSLRKNDEEEEHPLEQYTQESVGRYQRGLDHLVKEKPPGVSNKKQTPTQQEPQESKGSSKSKKTSGGSKGSAKDPSKEGKRGHRRSGK
ncbi:hypothetical protein BDR22DRAFT_889881 [Usnea florida]